MVAGNTLTVDTGASAETVTITTVGTAGAGGTGVTVHARAHLRSRQRRVRDRERRRRAPRPRRRTTWRSPSCRPRPTPPRARASARRRGSRSSPTPARARTPSTTSSRRSRPTRTRRAASAHLALFYYFYPLSACQYVQCHPGSSLNCHPSVGYASSTNGGARGARRRRSRPWAASRSRLARARSARPGTAIPISARTPSAAIIPTGPLAGKATSIFDFGDTVDGFDESMYTPTHGLTVGGGS